MSPSRDAVAQAAAASPSAFPLLRTKLYLPPARPELVPRARLMDQITAGVQGALTLITAPAGFGKTALFATWRSSPAGRGYRVAWLSLDPDDDEPARFLQYLTGALDTAVPGAFEQVTVQFRLAQLPPMKAILAAMLNCLAPLTDCEAPTRQDEVVLALDDYHVVENPEIHQAVEYLLEHLPPCLHLVILSRADPALRLARLEARGQLTEVRAGALRFTPDETTQFLNGVMRLDLPAADIAALVARTEGWVAGLKLAALRLAEPGLGRQEATRFIQTLGTNHRFAAAFLVEEVVSRQPPAVQEFLLRSSVLERLCAPLCDKLMQAVDGHGPNTPWPSEEVIEHLVHRNLFVVPLDEEGRWYRYHHLFRDLLRARLTKDRPAKALALHRAAAEWYESQDLLKEAVKHAILTEDWDYAAGMVERHGARTLGLSDLRTLGDWCASFPEEVMRKRPALCIFHAWALLLSYKDDNVQPFAQRLELAEQALKDPDLPELAPLAHGKPPISVRSWVLGNVIQLRAAHMLAPSYRDFDPHALIEVTRQSMELLRDAGDGVTDSVNFLNLAYAYMAMPDAVKAEAALAEARRRTIDGGNYFGGVTSFYYQAFVAFCQGDFERVEGFCREGREVLGRLLGNLDQNLPAIRSLDVALGFARLELGRLVSADELLSRALNLSGWAPWVELSGHIALARLRGIQGDLNGQRAALAAIESLGANASTWAQGLRLLEHLRASPRDPQLLAEAAAWAQPIKPDLSKGVPMGIKPSHNVLAYAGYLSWANVMVILGDGRAALTFIQPALAVAQAQGFTTRVIELSLAEALAHSVLGESRRSWDALERALAAAESKGHLRTFDQGEQLTKLLAEAAGRGLRRRQIRAILDVIGWPAALAEPCDERERTRAAADVAVAEPQAAEFFEPLSEREREILGLIAAGLSNAQIAARLFIGTGTVKTHVNHLFGKLDASSRTQLLARARILKLLP